ncbi:choice-of-anchor I family protein [Candidatus Chloroploca sp. Khr17]|uniref:choice-of-anchor I family protein n=1 Tax=Candidatus Chloroploca sp. Khr17 TaxID=2496869 RepID=UPI00101C77A2|nr:choice-of-anchor I family protein [Candidatus Chloroploca sp. Khr17]
MKSFRALPMLVILALLAGIMAAAVPATAALPPLNQPAATVAALLPDAPNPTISLNRIGRYDTGLGAGAAEITAFDPATSRMFVINAVQSSVDIVSLSDPTTPSFVSRIAIAPTYGAGPNSVVVHNGLVAVAVEADPKTDAGSVVFFDTNGAFLNQVTAGALPDMVTFTPDGRYVLVANEGEPNSYGQPDSVDPEGSVSIIWLPPSPITTTTVLTPTNATFTSFNSQVDDLRASGVRIFGPGATVAQDLEPEYIAVSPDSTTAYVSLQENNAVAVIDISTATVSAIVPLGFKDHSLAGNGFDASDRDVDGTSGGGGQINIQNWPVFGMYMPDTIAAYEVDGQLYLVTANEGDARDYTGFAEEVRVGSNDYTLDPTVFTDTATLKLNQNLGRLTVTNQTGDTNGDGAFESIYLFGARSFTIWNATTGAVVFDSGDEMEQRTAVLTPGLFNANNGLPADFDTRSDNKGPEPESVELGQIAGRTYAFVGLERSGGGVMVYDITNPAEPTFVQYALPPGDYTGDPANAAPDDVSPEGLKFVSAADSPTGQPLLLVANEVSGTVAIYAISFEATPVADPDGAGSLTLLHNNDGESSLLPQNNTVTREGLPNVSLPVGGVAAFQSVLHREIADASMRGNALVNVYAGDAFLASATLACSLPTDATSPVFDAIAQRQMPYTVHILGNHEFDYTPVFLKRFIDAFQGTQPFLSANLDFSAQTEFATLVDADGLIEQNPADGRVLGRSMIYTDTLTNQRFGIVGAMTPLLPTISSPDQVEVTPDIPATAAAVQAEIDRLQAAGLKKIILVSHMQSISQDRELIALLKGVDIAVAGGGDDLLTNPDIPNNIELLPGDRIPSENPPTYPLIQKDADDRDVYLVTTAGNYRYVGRLDVEFDAAGEVSQIISEQSYPRRVVPASAIATLLEVADVVTPNSVLGSTVIDPVNTCLADFATDNIARSEVALRLATSDVRSRESNAGNLIADSFLYAYEQYAATNSLPPRSEENPVIAIQNGGGIRQTAGNAIPVEVPGTITRKNTLDILPFANFVSVVSDVTPAELKLILERSAASLPANGGQFMQIAGLRVTYSPANQAHVVTSAGEITTPGARVLRVALEDGRPLISNGQPVEGAPNVRIVTNSFTAGGGDNYPTLANKPNQVNLRSPAGAISYEQALLEYLRSFPVREGLPTIEASDLRYAPEGEGRIVILSNRALIPIAIR